jgi:ABC-type branched-subunit amino acid transport system substrate-binding protein
MSRRWTKLLALVVAFALVVAACGDSDDDSASGGDTTATTEAEGGGETTETSEASATTEGAAETTEGGSDTTAASGEEPASMEEWEALWGSERQAIVDEIVDGGYGVDDDGVLTGPGGFELDLSTCPSEWNETQGIGDTIKIGYSNAQSGTLAAYGDIGVAWEVYVDHVNANGGIDGVPMELVMRDDGYVASQTIENVDQMLQSDQPFLITTLGSPNTLAVRDTINSACVPHPFAQTGLPAWADPDNYPWTTGLQLSYYSEAALWVQWIEENLADQAPVKVAALVIDNDGGIAWEGGFEQFAEESDVIGEFVVQQHDPAAPTVTNEVTSLAGEDPQVFILMTAGTPCTQGLQDAATSGLIDKVQAAFLPSVCKAISSFLEPAGEAADDYYIVGGGVKDITDAAFADDPFITFFKGLLEDAGLTTDNSTYGSGALFAWAETEALKVASMLPGGLTRSNYILAVRSMDMTHPMLFPGIAFEMNGLEDASFVEGSEIAQYDYASRSYEIIGEVVDANGQSGLCQWVDGEGCATE